MSKVYSLRINDREYVVEVMELGSNRFKVRVGDKELVVELVPKAQQAPIPAVTTEVARTLVTEVKPEPTKALQIPSNVEVVTAPVPGKVVKVLTTVGANVNERTVLLTLESMKMELEIYSTCTGRVREVKVKSGDPVNVGDVLVLIERT